MRVALVAMAPFPPAASHPYALWLVLVCHCTTIATPVALGQGHMERIATTAGSATTSPHYRSPLASWST